LFVSRKLSAVALPPTHITPNACNDCKTTNITDRQTDKQADRLR